MSQKILINAVDPEECRIAKVKDNKLEEFHIESTAREIIKGNIYKGLVTRVEPSLQAVFVDFGAERHGFLQKQDIHSDYFQDNPSGDHSLKQIIRRGQEILVQVTRDPIMNKGAALTTFISLPGRRMVLMPGSKTLGISRKIEDETDRKNLKKILESLKIPEEFGAIVRTAGRECTKTMLVRDLNYLLRHWKTIKTMAMESTAPELLYKEKNLAVRSIRDYFTPDISEILIDNADIYQEIREFMHIIAPKHVNIVKLFKGDKPIFNKYDLEKQIASIFEKRIGLRSGGSIVIEQTEALVSIDVNSGKATQSNSIEQTAYQINLEAAEEIARQLRLRDLGGLIVIDFIDMRDQKHKNALEKALKDALQDDKARCKIGKISRFGLLELSRQRIRRSLESDSFEMCRHCRGKGLTRSVEIVGLQFLRKLRMETLKQGLAKVHAVVPRETADYLLNRKRPELQALEQRRNIEITITGDIFMTPEDHRIVAE